MAAKLGELLVQAGVLTPAQIESALGRQRTLPGKPRLGEVILAMGLTTEETILRVLSHALRLPAVDLSRVAPTPEAIGLVSVVDAEKHLILPLRVEKEGARRRLILAMADPTNVQIVDELQFKTGMVVRPVVASARQVRDSMIDAYHLPPPMSPVPGDRQQTDPTRQETWIGMSPIGEAEEEPKGDVAELRFVNGPWRGRTVKFPAGATRDFGRGDSVNVSIPDMRMSRRHFLIVDDGEALELVDLGSRNGTLVNQKRTKHARLKSGDFVEAGETIIEISLLARR